MLPAQVTLAMGILVVLGVLILGVVLRLRANVTRALSSILARLDREVIPALNEIRNTIKWRPRDVAGTPASNSDQLGSSGFTKGAPGQPWPSPSNAHDPQMSDRSPTAIAYSRGLSGDPPGDVLAKEIASSGQTDASVKTTESPDEKATAAESIKPPQNVLNERVQGRAPIEYGREAVATLFRDWCTQKTLPDPGPAIEIVPMRFSRSRRRTELDQPIYVLADAEQMGEFVRFSALGTDEGLLAPNPSALYNADVHRKLFPDLTPTVYSNPELLSTMRLITIRRVAPGTWELGAR